MTAVLKLTTSAVAVRHGLCFFLLTQHGQLGEALVFPLCAQAVSVSSGPLVHGGCPQAHFPCAQRGQVNPPGRTHLEAGQNPGGPPHTYKKNPDHNGRLIQASCLKARFAPYTDPPHAKTQEIGARLGAYCMQPPPWL